MHRQLPSLNALRAFEAAARLQSVSRAGKELHVTHGAISRQIRILEDQLGVSLFLREGRGLVLTDAGQYLCEHAGASLDRLHDACRQLRHKAGMAPIVLGCSSSVLARWIIPRLARLHQQLPQQKLHLSVMAETPDAALTGLDAALLSAEPPWPASWQVHPLANERIGPVLSPNHVRYAALGSADLQALYKEPLLHTRSRPQAWPVWAAAQGIATERLQAGQEFDHLYYLLEAAVAGLGVAIAPQPLVADDMAAGRLCAPWGFVSTQAQWMLCLPARSNSESLGPLLQWLRRELAGNDDSTTRIDF